MNVHRYQRAGGVMARLLLVLVLALGVFAMHTLGHPGDSSASERAAGGQHAATSAPHDGHRPAPEAGGHSGTAEHQGHGAVRTGVTPEPDEPGHGMDMSTLCVAVLGVWALASLMWAALGRRREEVVSLPTTAVALPSPRPPPRPPTLAQLSLLRI